MTYDAIFFISSALITTNTLSKYNSEERYKQTLKTISTIREKVKNSIILFIDVSLVDAKEYLEDIYSKVDMFVECTDKNDEIDNYVCNTSAYEEIEKRTGLNALETNDTDLNLPQCTHHQCKRKLGFI